MRSVKQLMDLSGRSGLITGATGVLGRVYAETLAELECDLILLDRPGADFNSLVRSLREYHTQITCLECDLEQQDDRQEAVQTIQKKGDSLDIFINNAAFVGDSQLGGWVVPFADQTLETWRRAVEVNLTSVFDLCQQLTGLLKNSGNGTIINIASIYGVAGPDYSLYAGTAMGNPAAYAASKGGLIQLTRWLATSLAPSIRVNAVSPGGVYRQQPEEFVARYEKRTPLGRMANEEDLKGIIAFLATDLSKYVTGQNFLVDGGWTVW